MRIPAPLADKADALVASGTDGYSSRADVVSDALRRFFAEKGAA